MHYQEEVVRVLLGDFSETGGVSDEEGGVNGAITNVGSSSSYVFVRAKVRKRIKSFTHVQATV